ncbi:MAG: hypothetical protein WD138_06070, partial [Halofilum sp. (in: g-proteobacteria)]
MWNAAALRKADAPRVRANGIAVRPERRRDESVREGRARENAPGTHWRDAARAAPSVDDSSAVSA